MAEPFDPIVAPVALLTHGLTAFDTVEGIGLVTFGFLWPCNGIWAPAPEDQPRDTVWVMCPDSCDQEPPPVPNPVGTVLTMNAPSPVPVGVSGAFVPVVQLELTYGTWLISGTLAAVFGGGFAGDVSQLALSKLPEAVSEESGNALSSFDPTPGSVLYTGVGPRVLGVSVPTMVYLVANLNYSVLGAGTFYGTNSSIVAERVG